MQIFQKRKYAVLVATIQWYITTILQIDRAFFSCDEETKVLFIVKGLYFLFLVATWDFVFRVINKIKEKNEDYLRGMQIFTFYCILEMIALSFLWPGTWTWDDVWTLDCIQWYRGFNPWQ